VNAKGIHGWRTYQATGGAMQLKNLIVLYERFQVDL
jgi:hypothetical protein